MYIMKVLERLSSFFIACINFCAGCSLLGHWNRWETWSKSQYYIVFLVVQVILVIPLVFIWFGDYLASLEWGDQTWRIPHWDRQMSLFASTPSLIKLAGWIFLLLPALVFVFKKVADVF